MEANLYLELIRFDALLPFELVSSLIDHLVCLLPEDATKESSQTDLANP